MNTEVDQQFEDAARYLRVLGHPVRLKMVEALRSRSWCVCELAAHLGLHKSAASKHLSQLRDIGVVGLEKDGTQVNCTLLMPCVFDMMRCANFFGPGPESSDCIVSVDRIVTGCCANGKKENS
jgi:ArsR family transcriptional regulator